MEYINECPICLIEIKQTDFHITSCNHIFCKNCIDTWLHNHNNCPICRHILKEQKQTNIYLNLNLNLNLNIQRLRYGMAGLFYSN